MNILKTIRDADVGSTTPPPDEFRDREAGRAVVFDKDGKVALFHSTKKHYHKLPGGGVEEGEDIETALRREILEEIGCAVENIRELAVIEEYRNEFALRQVSHCFVADVLGEKGEPNLDEGEIEEGFVTEWLYLDDAVALLASQENVEDYQGKFIQMRDLAFLRAAQQKV